MPGRSLHPGLGFKKLNSYKGPDWDNWRNVIQDCIFDNSTPSGLNSLIVVMEEMPLLWEDACKVLRVMLF